MRITICRGETSLVRVENRGRVGYFNAGRYLSDKRIIKLANTSFVNLRSESEASFQLPFIRRKGEK